MAHAGGPLRCTYCGSANANDVSHAIKAGAQVEIADQKCGWPHKLYLMGVGTWLKFYTEHLQDATPEDRDVIERAIGLRLTFTDGNVSWSPVEPA